jgi:hypothetical protein
VDGALQHVNLPYINNTDCNIAYDGPCPRTVPHPLGSFRYTVLGSVLGGSCGWHLNARSEYLFHTPPCPNARPNSA